MDKLNIGSNSFVGDGWLNLDHASARYSNEQTKIDLPHDLMGDKSIDLDNETLSAAYTSHTIEHIGDVHVKRTFQEVYRMLKPGGVFRVSCPDASKCYDAYVAQDKDYLTSWIAPHPSAGLGPQNNYRSFGMGEQLVFMIASNLSPYSKRNVNLKNITKGIRTYNESEIKDIFDERGKENGLTFFTDECQEKTIHLQKQIPGNHVSWWSFDKLKTLMESVGFIDVAERDFNESSYEVFNGFDEKNKDSVIQKQYSVFVEAKK